MVSSLLCLLVLQIASLYIAPAIADVSFSIVHFNDIHSRVEPADSSFVLSCEPDGKGTDGPCFGGFAKLKTVIDIVKAAGATLVVDAGDEFVGTLYSYFYRGYEAATFQNMIGVQAMTLGNHEFDYGPDVLKAYIKNLTFPVVTCNVVPKDTSTLFNTLNPGPRTIDVALSNGTTVKVGLVGWTTTSTAVSSSPGPDIDFLPLVSSVQSCVDTLKSQGINIIIGLGHAGAYFADGFIETGGDYDVAAEVTGLDLVIGGHSHTLFYDGVPAFPGDENGLGGSYPFLVPSKAKPGTSVPYLQALWGGRYAGNVSVTFDDAGVLKSIDGNPILMGNSSTWIGNNNQTVVPIVADPAVVAKTLELGGPDSPLASFTNVIVGATLTPLDISDATGRTVRRIENSIGNLITDAMLWEIKNNTNLEKSFGEVNIAFENGGGIRSPIPAGNITINQVVTTLPFGNVLSIKNMTGWAVLQALERSVALYPAEFGGFLQVGGLAVVFDEGKTPLVSRVISANLLNYAPNQKGNKCLGAVIANSNSSFYLVAMNDFTSRGGDGYSSIGASPYVFRTGRVLADIVNDYLTKYKPVNYTVEGRIRSFNSTKGEPVPLPTFCAPPPNPWVLKPSVLTATS